MHADRPIDERRDAPVRIEAREGGCFVLSCREIEEDRVVGQAQLFDDKSDLPGRVVHVVSCARR